MSKPIAWAFALATALAPAAAFAQVSGGYLGAPLPPALAPHNSCGQIVRDSEAIEMRRLSEIPRKSAYARRIPWSCCVTGMCTEGGGL